MKKNFFAVSALVLAIAVSSFTKKTVNEYFRYKSGNEALISNYLSPVTSQPTQISGTGILNWIKVVDNDGTVSQSEFTTAFNSYDTDMDGSLDNETVIPGALDRKNP